jgi:hypothetical protein
VLRPYLREFFRPTDETSEERYAAMVNNVAYTLQYLQFVAKVLRDLDLTDVLTTQTFKTFVINGCAVVEAVFYKIVSENDIRKKRPTFDKMCEKVERENLINADGEFYAMLRDLRRLRNRVHIFDREGRADTDYLKIDYRDFESMKHILRHLLIGRIFPANAERLDISFLDERTHW